MNEETGERIFVALSHDGYWGKGFSVEGALRQAAPGGFPYPHEWLVYKLPYGVYDVGVDGMGAVHWRWMEGTTAEHKATAKMELVVHNKAWIEAGTDHCDGPEVNRHAKELVEFLAVSTDLTLWINPDDPDEYVVQAEAY